MLKILRWGIVLIFVLGLPIFVYVAFIADEPVMPVEDDVSMGQKTVESIAADTTYALLAEADNPEG